MKPKNNLNNQPDQKTDALFYVCFEDEEECRPFEISRAESAFMDDEGNEYVAAVQLCRYEIEKKSRGLIFFKKEPWPGQARKIRESDLSSLDFFRSPLAALNRKADEARERLSKGGDEDLIIPEARADLENLRTLLKKYGQTGFLWEQPVLPSRTTLTFYGIVSTGAADIEQPWPSVIN